VAIISVGIASGRGEKNRDRWQEAVQEQPALIGGGSSGGGSRARSEVGRLLGGGLRHRPGDQAGMIEVIEGEVIEADAMRSANIKRIAS
jgi:hypothetical protein